jgi:NIMA (never in mitosis gene a)-related kinase
LAKLTEKEKENAINEVRILASVNHPNVASYKEAFFEQATGTLCIVMEFADGGDLQSKIDAAKRTNRLMKEDEIWSIFYQMVHGLHALHSRKIVHRDIKCANVFLTKSGTVKLGDLNVSKINKAGVMNTQTGTPYYASPEVWSDKPYDKSSDIWSLGAVLYEMTALQPPFTAKDMKSLYQRVIKGVYSKIPQQYSSDLSNMIASLLQVDPQRRPTTEQILHMPAFIEKYKDNKEDTLKAAHGLLGTIKVPKNLSLLTERLPKP